MKKHIVTCDTQTIVNISVNIVLGITVPYLAISGVLLNSTSEGSWGMWKKSTPEEMLIGKLMWVGAVIIAIVVEALLYRYLLKPKVNKLYVLIILSVFGLCVGVFLLWFYLFFRFM